MAKFFAFVLVALVAITMLQIPAMASEESYLSNKSRYGPGSLKSFRKCSNSAPHSAREDAARHSTTSPACSSVKSAAESAFACPRAFMATKLFALATTTGRPRKEAQVPLIQSSSSSSS
ncbi:UNVERIFIED_CONTAM: hypothetical protein Slati_1611300 [Sesamum latifolium]|uniref:Uncharacterized protein n=1 Tax=Sesamum latifolium TaxID=2727402 RepID=A0AAW2X9U0_9LAMI